MKQDWSETIQENILQGTINKQFFDKNYKLCYNLINKT